MSGLLHIMVDIETTGTAPGCGVWQIGAVVIDTYDGILKETLFSMTADPGTSIMTHDPDTLAWQETRNAINWEEAKGSRFTEDKILRAFIQWTEQLEGSKLWWSQGHFDYPILAEALKVHRIAKAPWTYSKCRDLRTITGWFGGTPIKKPKGAHNAAVDALYQAEVLWDFIRTKENYYVG